MRRDRPGRSKRALDIDILSRHYLALGLMKHPDAAKHVANVDEIESMLMLPLLKLAQKLGVVDVDALIDATERGQEAQRRYSDDFPAFAGRIEFDLTVEVFGKRVTRKARAEYEFTPEWEYWDLHKRASYEGWPGSAIRVEYLTVPEADNSLEQPAWREIDIMEIGEVWNAVDDAIEAQCEAEDAERRRLAAQDAASPARQSRARH
jgi:hypothetical protein